jgi:methionyl-tRNA formyltransferase
VINMRIIFAGTPEFAKIALEQLLAAGHSVPLVLTQPDRPAGRGLKVQASPVKQCAQTHGITVAQPRSLRLNGKYPDEAAAARDAIQAAQADVMVVAAYGLILPQWVLDAMSGDGPPLAAMAPSSDEARASSPAGGSAVHAVASVGASKLGCLNIHASLLPRWRGAAPIHRAIEAGDAYTGITIMQMDAGLDTGDMLLVEPLPIAADDTTPTLHDKLATLGGRCIVQALEQLARGSLTPTPQPRVQANANDSTTGSASDVAQAVALGITYAHKIDKAESRIDWSRSATEIERKVRALDPFPGCTAHILGETVKVNCSEVSSEIDSCSRNIPLGHGTILYINTNGIGVQCADGVLLLTQLQRAGGKRLPAADFLRGFALQVGQRFE